MRDTVDLRPFGHLERLGERIDRLPVEVVVVDLQQDLLPTVGVAGGVGEVLAAVVHVRQQGVHHAVLLEGER